jgi:hypothetical protein
VAAGTLALAAVTFWMVVKAGGLENATRDLVTETREDRNMLVRPFLIRTEQGTTGNGQNPTARIRNIGAGPAVSIRLMQVKGGSVYWTDLIDALAADDILPIPETSKEVAVDHNYVVLNHERGMAAVDPGLIDAGRIDAFYIYCRDQLGNGLRFRVATGDPPEIWTRHAPPPSWHRALDKTMDWRTAEARAANPMPVVN